MSHYGEMPMRLNRIGPFTYLRHPPTLPAQGVRTADETQVLIAGGGPVGLAVALGLARQGVDCVVVEADDAVCEGSRASCISRRSLEILDRLGVAGRFLDKGLAWTRGRSYHGADEVLVFEMPTSKDDRFPPMINLQQYYIEQYLFDEIEALNRRSGAQVRIHWASTVTDVQAEDQGVTVTLDNALGRARLHTRWLVACDGGQSFVRSRLGLALEGTRYSGRYAIVDIALQSDHPTERRAWFDPPWARGTTILMHRQPDDLWRVDFQLRADEDADEMLGSDRLRPFIQAHLDAIGEGGKPWHPVWTSVYRAGAMTLASYRHGRVLLAGNAAHAMPIFGVRGLNSGFDDADNLIWKLAAVCKGQADEGVLDSYSSERVQAFHVNAANAMRSTEYMSPPNRGFELMREASLSLARRHPGIARLINPRQTHAITYEDSPLSSPDQGFAAGPGPGAPLQDLPAGGGLHLSQHLATDGFTLLCFGESAAAADLAATLAAAGPSWPRCRVVALPGDDGAVKALAHHYGAGPGAAYLVRPDGHVAGRWQRPTVGDLVGALARACGRTGVKP